MDEDLSQEEMDIPFSDMDSASDEGNEDVVPYTRLTINNSTALMKAYDTLRPAGSLPFSARQTVDSAAQTDIQDVNDDLGRELALYKQSLDAATEAYELLSREGIPFTRPKDFFAEMVKSDEHMEKIKSKIVDEAASKKATAEARKQRDLKKFGKQVQVAKLQERDRAKRQTLDKISQLKRRRRGADLSNTAEEDVFDVALEDESEMKPNQKRGSNKHRESPLNKRRRKDQKFGFGGKKRFAKSGDAASSGDLSAFSTRKMKGQRGISKRPGKSRRAKTR